MCGRVHASNSVMVMLMQDAGACLGTVPGARLCFPLGLCGGGVCASSPGSPSADRPANAKSRASLRFLHGCRCHAAQEACAPTSELLTWALRLNRAGHGAAEETTRYSAWLKDALRIG